MRRRPAAPTPGAWRGGIGKGGQARAKVSTKATAVVAATPETKRTYRADAPPSAGIETPTARQIVPPLLRWYEGRKRNLPWRRQPSPYRTLVSEFMLQQTVVATVIPYFERFVSRLPDVRALALASEDEVLALWSGLGYYSRARNLHRAGATIVARHGGALPEDEASLRELPGVGPYTAAAVAAIAFGKRTFALDGNAARVVARLAAVVEPIDLPATRQRLRAIGEGWVPARRAGDFAQAIMELGATVCAPRAPACPECPLSAACQARGAGATARIPQKTPRRARGLVRLASVRLRRDGRVLLVRRAGGLLARTWMLPAHIVNAAGGGVGDGAGNDARAAAWKAVEEMGIVPRRVTRVGTIRHVFTHRDVTVEVFDVAAAAPTTDLTTGVATGGLKTRASADASPPFAAGLGGMSPATERLWADERRLGELAVSSFLRKQLDLQGDKTDERP